MATNLDTELKRLSTELMPRGGASNLAREDDIISGEWPTAPSTPSRLYATTNLSSTKSEEVLPPEYPGICTRQSRPSSQYSHIETQSRSSIGSPSVKQRDISLSQSQHSGAGEVLVVKKRATIEEPPRVDDESDGEGETRNLLQQEYQSQLNTANMSKISRHADDAPKYANTGYCVYKGLSECHGPTSRQLSVRGEILEIPENYAAGKVSCGKACSLIILFCCWMLVILTFPISLCTCIKLVQEYERAVIFRLGRIFPGGAKGPGMFFILPCIDTYIKIDLRTMSFDVPPQEILTKDSVTIAVDAAVYYRVFNATMSVTNVEDAHRSTRLLAQTTLRNVLGRKHLSDILILREEISMSMQETLDYATDSWGIKVERVELKDVRLPIQLQKAMATEAEAFRDAKAKVIAAEGEQKASKALRSAAQVINECPSAMQLRYLQTLTTVATDKNSTIIFPVPMDILQIFTNKQSSCCHSNQPHTNTSYQNQYTPQPQGQTPGPDQIPGQAYRTFEGHTHHPSQAQYQRERSDASIKEQTRPEGQG